MGRKNKPYSDKSAPYATMASKPDDYLYKKGKKQKLVGSADNSPEDGEEELEESGYRYEREEDIEFDGNNSKIWHYLITPDGERFTLNHSPYQEMSPEEFDKHVEEFRRGSLKETNMTDELNELRKAAGLPIVEDCDTDEEKNDDGDCSPFTHADENVEMVREDYHDEEVQRFVDMGKRNLWILYNDTSEEEDYPGRTDELQYMEAALERLGIQVAEDVVDEDFLAPPKDSEDTYDTGEGRTEPELDRQTDYNAPSRYDGDDSYDMSDEYPIEEATYTRKDFRMVADTLQKIEDPMIRSAQAEEYAAKFAASNPRFNKELFLKAAGAWTGASEPQLGNPMDEDENVHVGREFASSEFGGEGGNTHVGREFASGEIAEQGPGDDEFAHDEDAMVDIGDEDYDGGEDLSDFGGEYYGDSQYYEAVEENVVEMNELRKLAGMEPVTEGWRDPEGVNWKEANLVSPDEYDDKGRRLITKADLEANGPIYGDRSEVTGSGGGTSTGSGNDNWAEIKLMKGFPNMKEWWNEDPKDIMGVVYWQKNQLPPSGEAFERNWQKVKANLQAKYPAPEGGLTESEPHNTGDYDFIDFKDETGYYLVADEIGDRVIFGMNNEVGIPEQYTDKIIGLLRAQGLEKGIDYDFTSFANQSIGGEPVEEDGELQNGYNDKKYADGEDFFPKGSHQSPSDDLGPTASGYGDNAMQNRMRSKEADAVYEGMKQKYRRHRLS